jgi:hypothetical protein
MEDDSFFLKTRVIGLLFSSGAATDSTVESRWRAPVFHEDSSLKKIEEQRSSTRTVRVTDSRISNCQVDTVPSVYTAGEVLFIPANGW